MADYSVGVDAQKKQKELIHPTPALNTTSIDQSDHRFARRGGSPGLPTGRIAWALGYSPGFFVRAEGVWVMKFGHPR